MSDRNFGHVFGLKFSLSFIAFPLIHFLVRESFSFLVFGPLQKPTSFFCSTYLIFWSFFFFSVFGQRIFFLFFLHARMGIASTQKISKSKMQRMSVQHTVNAKRKHCQKHFSSKVKHNKKIGINLKTIIKETKLLINFVFSFEQKSKKKLLLNILSKLFWLSFYFFLYQLFQ
jgi:hypothetical protein